VSVIIMIMSICTPACISLTPPQTDLHEIWLMVTYIKLC